MWAGVHAHTHFCEGPTQNDQQNHHIQKIDAKVLNFILKSYLTNEKVLIMPKNSNQNDGTGEITGLCIIMWEKIMWDVHTRKVKKTCACLQWARAQRQSLIIVPSSTFKSNENLNVKDTHYRRYQTKVSPKSFIFDNYLKGIFNLSSTFKLNGRTTTRWKMKDEDDDDDTLLYSKRVMGTPHYLIFYLLLLLPQHGCLLSTCWASSCAPLRRICQSLQLKKLNKDFY